MRVRLHAHAQSRARVSGGFPLSHRAQDAGTQGEMSNVLRVFNDSIGVVPSPPALGPAASTTGVGARACVCVCPQELTQRTGRNPNYQYVQIGCSKTAAETMLAWSRQQVGKPFSSVGMVRSLIWPRKTDNTSFYCAELVAACLKVGGLMSSDSNPGTATPAGLYRLYKSTGAVQANPYKLRQSNFQLKHSPYSTLTTHDGKTYTPVRLAPQAASTASNKKLVLFTPDAFHRGDDLMTTLNLESLDMRKLVNARARAH